MGIEIGMVRQSPEVVDRLSESHFLVKVDFAQICEISLSIIISFFHREGSAVPPVHQLWKPLLEK